MTSPDVSEPEDLSLYDAGPGEMYDRALALAPTVFAEWTAEPGDTTTALVEVFCQIAAELVYAINRLAPKLRLDVLDLFQVPRSAGVAATASVTFALSDTAGHTIPAGTLVRLDLGGEVGAFDFATDVAVAVASGVTTLTAAVTAVDLTDVPNGVPSGTAVQVLSPVTFVDSAVLATDVAGGAAEEDDAAYLTRGTQRLQRLTIVLSQPRHFQSYALETPGVFRALAVDNYNADTDSTEAGYVAVAVLGPSGALLSGGAKTALQGEMTDLAQVNLAVRVVDPDITTVPVTATVHRLPGYTDAEVEANVITALQNLLSTDTWGWSATVRRNDIIAAIEDAPGVDYLDAGHPTAPAADVALAGVAPLAALGTPTITVTS